ncbi:MAG TPA: polysaccharide deacetylase family protein [Acidimicrobiia bacterium]
MKWASVFTDLAIGKRSGPRILIYHQVGGGSGLEMDLEIEAFGAQLDWMLGHGEIVDLETAVSRRSEVDADRMYVLTFDDGHISLFRHAFPLMRELGIPFTLYVTTAPLESDRLLHGDPRMRLSSWDHLGEMRASGLMTVGAHGHGHLDARSNPRAVLEEDLARCNELLYLRLGVSPRHFAYPWGHRSDVAAPLVRRLYDSAVIGSGPDFDVGTDLHEIPRIPVMHSDGSSALFARKMWGGFRLETRLRAWRDRRASA